MRPPLRSIRHTKTPRTDHDTSNLTRVPEFGSIADSGHSHVIAQIVISPLARRKFSSCDKRKARGTNIWLGTCHGRTAILSPSPRAWPFVVGRSRYADRLRPNLLSS